MRFKSIWIIWGFISKNYPKFNKAKILINCTRIIMTTVSLILGRPENCESKKFVSKTNAISPRKFKIPNIWIQFQLTRLKLNSLSCDENDHVTINCPMSDVENLKIFKVSPWNFEVIFQWQFRANLADWNLSFESQRSSRHLSSYL